MTIKEALTAYYDPATGTIHNCEKHSLVWFHEDRHRQQFENPKVKKINTLVSGMAKNGMYLILLGFIVSHTIHEMAGLIMGISSLVLFFLYLLFDTLIELDAVFYQFKAHKKHKKELIIKLAAEEASKQIEKEMKVEEPKKQLSNIEKWQLQKKNSQQEKPQKEEPKEVRTHPKDKETITFKIPFKRKKKELEKVILAPNKPRD